MEEHVNILLEGWESTLSWMGQGFEALRFVDSASPTECYFFRRANQGYFALSSNALDHSATAPPDTMPL